MISVKLRNLRIAPRKVRLAADSIRGKSVKEASAILNFTSKKAAGPVAKLLDSALAAAKNNFQLNSDNLYISKITVDEGRKLKRWRARARGSAYTILKRTSRVTLVLDEIVKGAGGKAARAEEFKGIEKIKAAEITPKTEKPVSADRQTKSKIDIKKPASAGVIKRIFRRKAF